MRRHRPLVSIGLPVYDGEAYLQETLDSLRDQEVDDLEIIISDNGSTDRTAAIAERAAARDPRVRVLRQPSNRGAAWNYVEVYRNATAPFFKWAAHDDLCRPAFLARCLEALEADPGAVAAYPRTTVIDAGGRPVGSLDDGFDLTRPEPAARVASILGGGPEYHPIFGVIRRGALASTQVMGAYVGSDIVTLAELAMRGRVLEVPERLFLRRLHAGTSVQANPDALARARWFDPSRAGGYPMPVTRLSWELLRAVGRAPLLAGERARCTGAVLRWWAAPRSRDIGGELKRSLRRSAAA